MDEEAEDADKQLVYNDRRDDREASGEIKREKEGDIERDKEYENNMSIEKIEKHEKREQQEQRDRRAAENVVREEERGVERVKECPECHSRNLVWDYERAEMFCGDCGLVIAENLVDLGPEWRAFDFEQASQRERVGAPMTYRIHDKGLSTLVTSKGLEPLGRWHIAHITNTTERSFIYALSEIDRMASALKLPVNIREAAAKLYREVMEKNLIRGRSIEGITSAILYITCRQYGIPRTLEEIKSVSRVSQREISRAYRFILRELDIKLPPASPIEFVPRFCSRLGLGGDVRAKAIEIIKKAQEKELTNGRGPIGVAAAAIYIAAILSGKHRTQKEISEATGVTEVTIRNRYRELSEKLDIQILL
ncbi:MAG: transcription initiation factor IIB [Canidatus Methanoxibalbensis ujae]|nr:transcription initiation factor IIB [Candidatus Methanoxibalbensis ujae]